jgi:hypothetical protein
MRHVRIFTGKILDLVDEGILDPKGVLRNLLAYLPEQEVKNFWESEYSSDFDEEEEEEESDDDSDSDDGEDDDGGWGEDGEDGEDDDGGWGEESANMAGMAGGANAYNEAMGYGEGDSEGW